MDRFTTLLICGGVLLFLWVTVLGLIFSDLWAEVRKAKKAGVYRTSDGYKKTIDKMARYYNMMLPLALMDTSLKVIVAEHDPKSIIEILTKMQEKDESK